MNYVLFLITIQVDKTIDQNVFIKSKFYLAFMHYYLFILTFLFYYFLNNLKSPSAFLEFFVLPRVSLLSFTLPRSPLLFFSFFSPPPSPADRGDFGLSPGSNYKSSRTQMLRT